MAQSSVTVISSDLLDRTLVVDIGGVRYEYWFHGEVPLSTVNKLLRYSHGRAIQYLKRNSYKVDRLTTNEEQKQTI